MKVQWQKWEEREARLVRELKSLRGASSGISTVERDARPGEEV